MASTPDAFLEEVKQAFAQELGTGMLEIAERKNYSGFGDTIAVLEGPGFRLKLKRERHQSYALLAPIRDPEAAGSAPELVELAACTQEAARVGESAAATF